MALIREYFSDDATRALAIARCESGLKQWDSNGRVIMSHTKDAGVMQINLPVHQKKAESLGLDVVNNIEDNVKYAKLLHDAHGFHPWVCAKQT